MSAIPEAVRASLPKMEQGAPMPDTGAHPDGAIAEATKKIAAATLQLVEQVQVVMRAGDESKRRSLLKAIELLTSEFPPEAGAGQGEGGVSDAVMQSLQPGAPDQSQGQPQPPMQMPTPGGMQQPPMQPGA